MKFGEAQVIEGLAVVLTLVAVLSGYRITALIGAGVTVAVTFILSWGRIS